MYLFSCSHVWMWELDYKESWAPKNFELWCWRRLLRVPWTARRSNQSILKEISPGYSLEGLDVEAETLILWPPDVKSWLIWKDPDAGKDWRWEEKVMTEDEMVGWHHWLNGYGFGWTLGTGDGQGGLACCGSWGRKELDMTEQLNWTDAPIAILLTVFWLFCSSFIFIFFLFSCNLMIIFIFPNIILSLRSLMHM